MTNAEKNPTNDPECFLGGYAHYSDASPLLPELFPHVQMVGESDCRSIFFFERSGLQSVMVGYTLEGGGTVEWEGSERLLPPNTCFLIDCMKPHSYWTSDPERWRYLWLHFDGANAYKLYRHILRHGQFVFPCNDDFVKSQILEIVHLYDVKAPDLQLRCFRHVYAILSSLSVSAESSTATAPSDLPDLIVKAIKIIKKNYTSKLTIEDLAHRLFVDKFNLTRKFKQHLGISPYHYLLEIRISQAKFFLRNSEISVGQISGTVGFEDCSHFVSLFKKYVGITPLQYRFEKDRKGV